jgi:hypothetical protein
MEQRDSLRQSFIHVNLPSQTTDAIQRLLERAIEWRDAEEHPGEHRTFGSAGEQEFAGIVASGKEERLPADVPQEQERGSMLSKERFAMVEVLPGEEELIS